MAFLPVAGRVSPVGVGSGPVSHSLGLRTFDEEPEHEEM